MGSLHLYYRNENLLGIRDRRYKLLLTHHFQRPAGDSIIPGKPDRFVTDSIPLSLFDLWNDPGEQRNIAEDLPEKVKGLQQIMVGQHEKLMLEKRPSGIYMGPEPPIGQLWIGNN